MEYGRIYWGKVFQATPFLLIVMALVSVLLGGKPQVERAEVEVVQPQQSGVDLTKLENQPYQPARIELFQPEYRFKVIDTNVTPGAGLRWVLVARNRGTKDGMIFRVLIGDSFGPIERGKVVRLGLAQFWSNPGNLANFVVVLAIE